MKNTKFNWRCAHCGKRNIQITKFQFNAPCQYSALWPCAKCGKENEISFIFGVYLPAKTTA